MIAVIFEKWIHHTQRISTYYVIRRKGSVLSIHHEPLGIYQQGKDSFFQERANAYHWLASNMPTGVSCIETESVWLDYTRESCWTIKNRKNNAFSRLSSVYFYWTNQKNWYTKASYSWYAIGNKTYVHASTTPELFISCFAKE